MSKRENYAGLALLKGNFPKVKESLGQNPTDLELQRIRYLRWGMSRALEIRVVEIIEQGYTDYLITRQYIDEFESLMTRSGLPLRIVCWRGSFFIVDPTKKGDQ